MALVLVAGGEEARDEEHRAIQGGERGRASTLAGIAAAADQARAGGLRLLLPELQAMAAPVLPGEGPLDAVLYGLPNAVGVQADQGGGVDAGFAVPEPEPVPSDHPPGPDGPGDGWRWPSRSEVEARVRASWPEDPETAVRVATCESDVGEHPTTYALDAENGGPMQLNRATWEGYFWERYGWSWERVVTDLDIHFAAAREVFERGGGWFPWSCWS